MLWPEGRAVGALEFPGDRLPPLHARSQARDMAIGEAASDLHRQKPNQRCQSCQGFCRMEMRSWGVTILGHFGRRAQNPTDIPGSSI